MNVPHYEENMVWEFKAKDRSLGIWVCRGRIWYGPFSYFIKADDWRDKNPSSTHDTWRALNEDSSPDKPIFLPISEWNKWP